MGSRADKQLVEPGFTLIESESQYQATALAEVIENLVETSQGTLRSLRGPVRYELKASPSFGEMHGVFQADIDGQSVLLARAGSTLYRHRGWERDWEAIETGLNENQGAWGPDQFAVVGNRIVWCNGIDYPRIITPDGRVELLGFWQRPDAPLVNGPRPNNSNERPPNWNGYSWHGRVGTAGDTLEGQYGALLQGNWGWGVQYEDDFGDLSPISTLTFAGLEAQQANPFAVVKAVTNKASPYGIDDLLKQFLVTTGEVAEEKVAAIRLVRTGNQHVLGPEVRLLERIPGRRPLFYSDPNSDAELGEPIPDIIPTPRFGIMVPYQGGLAVAAGDTVYLSDPGFPGTYQAHRQMRMPDGDVTALAVVRGQLWAFTRRSIYAVVDDAEGLRRLPISQSVGCVAASSLGHLPDTRVIWRTQDGWHTYDPRNGMLVPLLTDHELLKTERLNPVRAVQSSAVVYQGTYYCSVALDSTERCNHILAYNGVGWKRYEIGYSIQSMCVTRDVRDLLLFAGRLNASPNTKDVWVWDREVLDQTNPAKTYVYETVWLRMAKPTVFSLQGIILGLLETSNATATVTVWKNQRRINGRSFTFRLHGIDFSKQLSALVLGTDTLQRAQAFWRRQAIDAVSCWSFKVRIEVTEPTFLHLAGLSFETKLVEQGGRIPRAGDL